MFPPASYTLFIALTAADALADGVGPFDVRVVTADVTVSP